MYTRKSTLAGLALLALSACSNTWQTSYDEAVSATVSQNWRVSSINVVVPETLSISEQNILVPNADIVWHGETLGDRPTQVAAIIKSGLRKGSQALRGSQRVNIQVVLHEFHALTPAAVSRAPSAVHNIEYEIQVFDARSGDPLTPNVLTRADLSAFVGSAAVIAAQSGQTQKVRIRDHIARVHAGWLGVGPDIRATFSGLGR